MSYRKIVKSIIFLSIIFFGLFTFCNFVNAQFAYVGYFDNLGNLVTPGIRPGIDASFPSGLSIFSPYEAAILGCDLESHPIYQLALNMRDLGRTLFGGYISGSGNIYGYGGYSGYKYPGFGNGPMYGSSFIFGDTIVTPYTIPGVGGGVSSTNLRAQKAWEAFGNTMRLLGYPGLGPGPVF